ncbi:MAG: TlpA disulfide reductase family protein [bacterium]|nr:TlpA disulfide reductase family protein [bacterium]
MKAVRILCLLILVSFLLTLSIGVQAQEEERPDFSLLEFKSGEQKNFNDILMAKVNILVVTSTTCGSCISELKALDWIRAKYKGDMAVVAAFIDRSGESRVYRYLEYYDFDLDMFLVDPGGAVPDSFKTTTVPTMIMFDRKGNERYRKVGYNDGDESNIITRIEEIMYSRKPALTATAAEGDASAPAAGAPAAKTTGCASTG